MLPKKRRVPKEFFKKIEKSRSFSGEFLSLRMQKEEGLSRMSFVVSKKIAKNAVTRNKLRRMGYAAGESLISKVSPGYVCIFYFKKHIQSLSVNFLREEIKKLLMMTKTVN